MREILFRGKAKANDEGINFDGWVYGSLLIRRCGEYEICGRNNRISFVMPVIPETVGQFTGLYDKNGFKVFEGDIVTRYKKNYLVTFDDANYSACFGLLGKDRYGEKTFFPFDFSEPSIILSVIGNIHDNPELVKEETK